MVELEEILQRVARTFTVRDIMVPWELLVCASNAQDARKKLEENPDYDVIPIVQSGALSSYLERNSDHLRTIGLNDLVSDGTSVFDLVDILSKRKFCFILAAKSIAGYVHFSDLNNPLVKLPYFVILEAFERYLIADMGSLITEDILRQILDPERMSEIKQRFRRQKKNRAELGWVTLLSFDEIVRCSISLGEIRLKQIQVQRISHTRNCVCHAERPLVMNHNDVNRLAEVKDICISHLTNSV